MQRHLPIRIGTRQSVLALAQAELVRSRLLQLYPAMDVALVPMATSGDKSTAPSLAYIGGKGLFTKELEEALEVGAIDIAVHSLKDMETQLRPGMMIAACLEREDPRDVLVAPQAKTFEQLPKGACVGTSSVRRAAQLKILRADLEIVPFRGNVTTRLSKVANGDVDATLLALAGLKRIGKADAATEILDLKRFLPAVGQGTIAIECKQNSPALTILAELNHAPSYHTAACERSLLAGLNGSCKTPIAGYARIENGVLRLDAMVATMDGSFHLSASREGDVKDAERIGAEVAEELLARGAKRCLA